MTLTSASAPPLASVLGGSLPASAPDGPRRRSLCAWLRARMGGGAYGGSERGDVPGWVLVTLMTAGLVITLWAVAGPLLARVFDESITSVTGPGSP